MGFMPGGSRNYAIQLQERNMKILDQRDSLLSACKSARELLMVLEENDHEQYTRSFAKEIKQLDDAIAMVEGKR